MFEADTYVGGHSHTVDLEVPEGTLSVDTGFIVHNDRTYPNFVKIMDQLSVATQDTEMSFSVKDERTGLEYNGGSLNKLFAQRRNLFRPAFIQMIREILRFNSTAKQFLNSKDQTTSLDDFLKQHHFKQIFIDKYLVPMGASIWSTVPADMLLFPAHAFIRFFLNHGLLDLQNRPQWKTIQGGSKAYVKKMTEGFRDNIHLHRGVHSIKRSKAGIQLQFKDGSMQAFDEVIIATHSDQALTMLAEPSPDEQRLLSAIPYQENMAILHTDPDVLPKRKRAWASWNYHLTREEQPLVALTYNMNILQQLETREVVNVTLNRLDAIDPDQVKRIISYHHPLFTREGLAAQQQKSLISGKNHTWYVGAYWGNGFHEDGVVSALDVVQHLGGQIL